MDIDSATAGSTPDRTTRASPPTCPDCGKRFSRLEHMKRHRLGHTTEPEYTCSTCAKSFYRLDALKRHQTIHTSPTNRQDRSTASIGNVYAPKVRRACRRCSRMKLKCDGLQPCQRCRKAGHFAHCYFRPGDSSEGRRSSLRARSQDIPEGEITLTHDADESDDIFMAGHQEHVWSTEQGQPTVHFDLTASAELDPRLVQEISVDTYVPSLVDDDTQVSILTGSIAEGEHEQDAFTFALDSAPTTDLDWLFSGFSPLDQVFDAFPPLSNWTLQTPAQIPTVEEPAPSAPSRATSPLRILSEAAALTTADEVEPIADSATIEGTPQSSRQRRQLLPRDVCAPSRRPSISEGVNGSLRQNWPTIYYPAAAGQPYLNSIFEPVSDEMALQEDTCQVPEFDDKSREAIISVADLLPPQDEASVRAVLSSIDNRSYNVMLQLYFEEFHALFPFLHVPTFNPAACSPFLLMAICAVGCSFSKMRQAAGLSDWLIDIAHRSVRAQCDQNMFHARSISTIQALLLCCITFGTSANRRLFEHGEALHSALATMVRRSNLLERRTRPSVSTEQERATWITFEVAKRTAWACFVADIELASCWKFSSTYIYDELRAELPCPDHIWAAVDTWTDSDLPAPTFLADLHIRIRQADGLESRSMFERKILALSLCNIGLSLAGAQNPFVVLSIEPAIREFGELLESTASTAARHPGPASTTYEALVRYNHLGLSVPFLDLQALGGRRGRSEAVSALKKIIETFYKDPTRLSAAAVLAGRIVYLVRSSRLLTTCTANILFYAALCLYAIARHLQDSPSPKARRVNLDTGNMIKTCDMTLSSASFTLKGVGDLSAGEAPSRILSVFSDMLLNEVSAQARGISKRLGRLLRHMAEAEKEVRG